MIPARDRDIANKEIFESLFDTFYSKVLRYLVFLLGNQAAAEDVAQEVFIKLYTNPPASQENIGGWLTRVGQRLAWNYLRGERRRTVREARAIPVDKNSLLTPEDTFLRAEAVFTVSQALEKLPERERLALLLRHSGLRYAEIAVLLDVPVSTVGNILARAQKKFLAVYDAKGE